MSDIVLIGVRIQSVATSVGLLCHDWCDHWHRI